MNFTTTFPDICDCNNGYDQYVLNAAPFANFNQILSMYCFCILFNNYDQEELKEIKDL